MIRKYRCKEESCCKEFLVDVPVTSKLESRKQLKVKCPRCKSKRVERLITDAPAIIYKGKGFYSTDKGD